MSIIIKTICAFSFQILHLYRIDQIQIEMYANIGAEITSQVSFIYKNITFMN